MLGRIYQSIVSQFSMQKKYRELEKMQLELQLQQESLEEKRKSVEEAKSNFLKNIYHEVRTPLNAIVGFTHLLESTKVNGKTYLDYVEIIDDSSKEFLRVMDDIVQASLLDADLLYDIPTNSNVVKLLEDQHGYFRILKKLKGKNDIVLLCTIPEELRYKEVFVDINFVQKIIHNLLSNAVKFTDKGKIEFGASVKDDEIEFYVSDTGNGMSNDEKSKVLDPFEKAQFGLQMDNGLGLGLSIASKLIELLGGKLKIDSVLGEGTRFSFCVPLVFKSNDETADAELTNNVIETKLKIAAFKSAVV